MSDIENENDRIKKYVKSHYAEFAASVDPSGHELNTLFQADILILKELTDLNAIPDRKSKWDKLFSHLYETTKPNTFVVFKKALQKNYSHLFEKFENQDIGATVSTKSVVDANKVEKGNIYLGGESPIIIKEVQIVIITPIGSGTLVNSDQERIRHSLPDDISDNLRMGPAATSHDQPDHQMPATEIDIDLYISRFREVVPTLKISMDPENGLLFCLHQKGIITKKEYEDLSEQKSYEKLNEDLIVKYIEPTIETHVIAFLEALKENDQEHIANLITKEESDKLLNPLGSSEIEVINTNLFSLVNLIDPYRMNFLYRLLRKNCITQRHKNRVLKCEEKVDELLTILKRRRYIDFVNFKICLRETMQNKIVDILEKGGIGTVRLKLFKLKGCDKKLIESKLIDLLTGYVDESTEVDKNLTPDQVNFIKELLKDLENEGIYLIGNSAWRSIALFFRCESGDSIEVFKKFQESGKLKEILERLFSYLLNSENYLQHLPIEIIELIVSQAIFTEWYAPCEPDVTNEFYLKYKIEKIWKAVFKTYPSVCISWQREITQRKTFRNRLLQKVFSYTIRRRSKLLIERMNSQCGFVDQLKKRNIITEAESERLKRYGEHELNKFILESLYKKKYQNLVNFLRLLEETCQNHLVYYVICFKEKSSRFGNNWPLDEDNRNRIRDSQQKLMEIDFLVNVAEPFSGCGSIRTSPLLSESEHGYNFSAEDTEITSIANPYKLFPSGHIVEVETQSQMSSPYRTGKKSDFKNSRPMGYPENLLQILFKKRCICESQKQIMEEQKRSIASELLLRILQNGSIKTYDLTADYLKSTEQRYMLDTLIGNYRPEDAHFSADIEMENTTGIAGLACFKNEIYVVARVSSIVNVYSGTFPFEEMKHKKLEIKQLKSPWDMCISDKFGSLIISDYHRPSKCVRTVQLLNREIPQAGKQLVGLPMKMSITQSDELVVVVEQDLPRRYSLISYSVPDINQLKCIDLPKTITKVSHASQISNGNFVISYERKNASVNVKGISELSCSGEGEFIRTLSDSFSEFKNWLPEYLCVDEYDRVFIADSSKGQSTGDRVLILNSSWSVIQPLLDAKAHHMDRPARLWYSPEKHQLIVGQGRYKGSFCIFNFNHVKGIKE